MSEEQDRMKVYVAFASGEEIIGVFTTLERAAAFAAEYNETTPEEADVQGFDVWQFAPKRSTYWIASASVLMGVSAPLATLRSQDVWTHYPIELPADVAASTFRPYEVQGEVYAPRSHRTQVLVFGWEEKGLKEKALKWLSDLTRGR